KSVKAAARAHNVPYHTLIQRIDGTALPKKQAHSSQALLTQAEQETLVEWVQYLGLSGLPVNKRTLRPKVRAIMEAKGRKLSENTVSKTWIRKFLDENRDKLKLARGSGLDPKRAQAFNFATV
ncbi:hypothetical protein BT96DRAFT_781438, partial [Gymnopus androsaceus JB14]